MDNKETTTKKTADAIRKKSDLLKTLKETDWKLFFSSVYLHGGRVRCASHLFFSTDVNVFEVTYDVCQDSMTSYAPIKVYSNDSNILDVIELAYKESKHKFYSVLIEQMKNHHSYVDFNYQLSRDFLDDVSDNVSDTNKDKHIFVCIDKSKKNVADDNKICEAFEKFSNLLLQKATASDATLMDVFFMLAYHTIDKIEFRPKEDMTELVAESLDGIIEDSKIQDNVQISATELDGCTNSCIKREHYIERIGYIDRKRYYDEDGTEHVIDLPHGRKEKFRKEEMLGCYIDRSNKNCSINANNNLIYLCDDYIKEFANSFEYFSYELMFDLVFTHEFGHLVFSYLDYDNKERKLSEGRANFFSSYLINMIDANYIPLIKIKTQKQPKDYQEPILIAQDDYLNKLFP